MTKYILLVVTVLTAPYLLWQERQSIERGNRLYRAGDPPRAVEVYRASEDAAQGLPAADYNLGTALLELDPDSAEAHLLRAVEGEDLAVRQRVFYNLGSRFLAVAAGATDLDSTARALNGAVEYNRAALRLDPTDQNARWNLALAQRSLDALGLPEEEAVADSAPPTEEAEESDGAPVSAPRRGAVEGEREALAGLDPGPMSEADAFGLLEAISDEAESLIQRILWSHRPDVPWWEPSAFPGGAW